MSSAITRLDSYFRQLLQFLTDEVKGVTLDARYDFHSIRLKYDGSDWGLSIVFAFPESWDYMTALTFRGTYTTWFPDSGYGECGCPTEPMRNDSVKQFPHLSKLQEEIERVRGFAFGDGVLLAKRWDDERRKHNIVDEKPPNFHQFYKFSTCCRLEPCKKPHVNERAGFGWSSDEEVKDEVVTDKKLVPQPYSPLHLGCPISHLAAKPSLTTASPSPASPSSLITHPKKSWADVVGTRSHVHITLPAAPAPSSLLPAGGVISSPRLTTRLSSKQAQKSWADVVRVSLAILPT